MDLTARADTASLVQQFREGELAKRRRNVLKRFTSIGSGDQVGNQIFLSHCWRSGDAARQKRKFDMFSSLTEARREGGPGLIFWADFLDLHAEGPVPWKREIDEAIQNCSKMVCFIDQDYLLSFNCLQELAYAVKYNKPLVVVMLDQGAWDLLTMMGGPTRAWQTEPANGSALHNFEGVELTPGRPLTLSAVTNLFNTLSSINFCACRELDFANLGHSTVHHNLRKFVEKDLEYAKEHSWLQHRALQWMMQDHPNSLLLNRGESDKWGDWCKIGLKAGILPVPTKLQLQYARASSRHAARARRLAKLLAVLVVGLILAGGVAAGVMAVRALSSEQRAKEAQKEAERQTEMALTERENALLARDEAEQLRVEARKSAREAVNWAMWATTQKDLLREQERQMGLLLLSTTRVPKRIEELRAVLYASEVASRVDEEPLVHPALHAVVKHLTGMLPYVFWELEGHTNWVREVAFSPDSRTLASASDDTSVRVWPLGRSTGTFGVPVREAPTVLSCDGSRVMSLVWSPYGTHLAAGTSGDNLCIWRNPWWDAFQADNDPSTRWNASAPLVIRNAHGGNIEALAFVGNGEYLASGGNDDRLLMWDLRPDAFDAALQADDDGVQDGPALTTPLLLAEILPRQGGDVRALAWSGAGGRSLLASGANSRSIALWDLSDPSAPALLARIDDAHSDDINSLAFSPDGSRLVSGSDDTTAKVWSINGVGASGTDVDKNTAAASSAVPTLQLLRALPSHAESVRAVAWSAVTGTLATVSLEGSVKLYWEADLRASADESPIEPFETLDGQGNTFTSGAWSPDGSQLATGTVGDRVRVWRTEAARLGSWGPQEMALSCHQARESIRSVAWSADATLVATGSTDATVCLWEYMGQTGDDWLHNPNLHRLAGHATAVRALAWSADSASLAAADDTGRVTVWRRPAPSTNTATAPTWTPRSLDDLVGKGYVRSVAFSADGALLAAGSYGNSVGVWLLSSGAFLELGGNIAALSVGLDAVAAGMFSTSHGGVRGHTSSVRTVGWAPDGYRLASGADDSRVLVWSLSMEGVADGALNLTVPPATLSGHSSTVRSVEWSVEGRLASASDDDTVRIWDLFPDAAKGDGELWNETLTLVGHSSNVRSVSWSPHGTHLASSGLDKSMMIWPVSGDTAASSLADAWRIDGNCQWSRWLDTPTVKLACARQAVADTDSFVMEMMMVDFYQQSRLLQQMTYGRLSAADLTALGYPMLERLLDELPPEAEASLPAGQGDAFRPMPLDVNGTEAGDMSALLQGIRSRTEEIADESQQPPWFVGDGANRY